VSARRRPGLLSRALVAGLAACLLAAAPAAAAEFAYTPGSVFAKAHPPLGQPLPGFACIHYQCGFANGGEVEAWVQAVEDAPEPTQAGGHPDFTTSFRFLQSRETPLGSLGGGHPRTVVTDTPAGAVGNLLAVPRCEEADFYLTVTGACPKESQVGAAVTTTSQAVLLGPVSSLVPSPGQPALLGFKAANVNVLLDPEVRSDSDYGLRITVEDIPIPLADYIGSTVTLWGVPHDPVHDRHRVNDVGVIGGSGSSVAGTPVPFLTAPTDCSTGPIDLTVSSRSWEEPEHWISEVSTAPEPSGCEKIAFDPSLSARPTTPVADQPSGLEVDVHTPQNNHSCEQIKPYPPLTESQYDCGLATSQLKDTRVTLPEGLTLDPSAANGLAACSPEGIGLSTPVGQQAPIHFDRSQPACPDASEIGTVEVETPLLEKPMPGTIYIAKPYENPFNSLLALYIVANDVERGLIVKLAAKVEADPATGRLTTIVKEAPELPFEHFFLHIKQGPHAPLRTPGCGDYTTDSQLTPYSDPGSPVALTDGFSISKGPGGSCDQPNSPSFDAGTVSPLAGSYSPFVLHLRRDDNSQNFHSITLSPPPGLVAKLAGVATCTDADLAAAEGKSGRDEQAHPSCPAGSQVGHVVAGAGAGPSPYYAPGNVYMAGPYEGAPLSMAIVTPAVAGPFDLGTIVVRTALHVDPATAQITAVSDPIPDHLTVDGDGFPLDVRSVDLTLDRNEFVRTGTSCEPSSVEAKLTSTAGQTADLSSRYQLAECTNLGFKPRIKLFLKGGTKRTGHPRLTVVLRTRPGDADISYLQLAMPRSEFLDQAHIRTVCTRVQYAADACPKGAVYGHAWVRTPILDYTLGGNVLLRSSDNTLPDLVPDLRGPAYQPIRIESAGKTDSVHGAIRNTFESIPDAPFGTLVTRLQGGKKGLLVNSRNICARTYRAKVRFKAHNGRTFVAHPKVHARCGHRRHKKHRKHRKHRHRRAHRSAVAHGSAVR